MHQKVNPRILFCWLITCAAFLLSTSCNPTQKTGAPDANLPRALSKSALLDKIKGGWAGQTIGVTFGGPVEFRFNGTFIGDKQRLDWNEGYLKKTMLEIPGLYDDLYMDLTFVEVFEAYGLNAPLDSFAMAYARAGYMLWHANQAGRYNILNGIGAPASGHWLNNPHADDIDYQIESDFAGLMCPGLPNAALRISDSIGHIMNYGDGWYGGVFIGALYALAFVNTDIETMIKEALQSIPPQSEFHQCISDVLSWHRQYPADWKETWFEVQKKWSEETGCPDGVYSAFNIDAKVNAAYVVMGLLYGEGDYSKTIEISTRCGQDADCNPSSAAGILGTLIGYEKIPAYWKQGLKEIEDMDFKYTRMSLNDAYDASFRHALEIIKREGGQVSQDSVRIPPQKIETARMEKCFEGHFPIRKETIRSETSEWQFSFDGIGFVLRGEALDLRTDKSGQAPIVQAELWIDNVLVETISLPADFTTRRHEICWKYNLPKAQHKVSLKQVRPDTKTKLRVSDAVIYDNQPVQPFQ